MKEVTCRLVTNVCTEYFPFSECNKYLTGHIIGLNETTEIGIRIPNEYECKIGIDGMSFKAEISYNFDKVHQGDIVQISTYDIHSRVDRMYTNYNLYIDK